jgi:SAM-dependent methyltransferase
MPVFDALRKSFDGVPRVLDLGSGPLSMLAHGASGGIIDLTAADPLADEYHALLQKHGHSPNCRLVRCFGERLADSFPLNHFHMIWIHNALDHSQDPAAVVRQSAQVLQIGGYLVIQGWTREGTAEGWNGLHQHDLYLLPDLRLVCESAGHTTPVCLADGLPIRIVEHSEPTAEPKRWLKAVYQKA